MFYSLSLFKSLIADLITNAFNWPLAVTTNLFVKSKMFSLTELSKDPVLAKILSAWSSEISGAWAANLP